MRLLLIGMCAFLLAIMICSCNGKLHTNDYYTDHGTTEVPRFPLIKPYEALYVKSINVWFVKWTQDTDGVLVVPRTQEMTILNRIVFLHSIKTVLNYEGVDEAWFVLIPDKHIERGFANKSAYQSYIHSIGFKREPKLYPMNQILQYFTLHNNIDWQQISEHTVFDDKTPN